MPQTIAETPRLILRRWEPGDLDRWLDHLNTPQVTEHLGGVRARAEVEEKFAKLAQGWEKDGFSFLAVALKPEGTFLGTAGLSRIENDAAPEELRGAVQIGWLLRADHWGRGYASEAARAAMALAFGRFGMARLYAQTALRNRASWAIMEKLGMGRRADLDYDDPRFDARDNPTIIYALDRAQWSAGPEETAS
jgi:RimJ/RimL family protein N-acetyltransferase